MDIAEYVEYSYRGDEFYIGVIAELSISPLPSFLVTTDSADDVNFTVSFRYPPYEQRDTARHGSVVSVPLPPPPVPPLPPLPSTSENEESSIGQAMGVRIFTDNGKTISVYVSQTTSGIYPALPCKAQSDRFERRTQMQYSYRLFPSVLLEQPLTRGLLLLVGCQDATYIQVFSTHSLSLPVGLNATVENLPSGDTIVTSFHINRLETVTISMTGDISSTYVTASRLVTVTLASLSQCSERSDINRATCISSYAQVVPSFTWGRKFLVSSRPFHSDGTAEYMIQTELSSSTSVTVTCSNSTGTYKVFQEHFLERNAGQVFKVVSNHYCSVESEHQIQVIQYHSGDEDTLSPLIIIPPTEQYFSDYTLPLLQHTGEDTREGDDSSTFYATIFVSASSLSSVEAEGNRVAVDGQQVLDGWNAIYCRGSEVCGYAVEVQLPLQSAVNVVHENPEIAFNVLVHKVSTNAFSYTPGFRLNDLTGQSINVNVHVTCMNTSSKCTLLHLFVVMHAHATADRY